MALVLVPFGADQAVGNESVYRHVWSLTLWALGSDWPPKIGQ